MKNILVTVAAVFFASAAMATGDVGRSFFTTGIDEREPVLDHPVSCGNESEQPVELGGAGERLIER